MQPISRPIYLDELLPELEAEDKGRILQSNITIKDITSAIAEFYGTNEKEIRKVIKGPQKRSEARKMAMYLSQEVAAARLCEIADYFNLNHNGSVSFITHQIRAKKREDASWRRKIDRLVKYIVKTDPTDNDLSGPEEAPSTPKILSFFWNSIYFSGSK